MSLQTTVTDVFVGTFVIYVTAMRLFHVKIFSYTKTTPTLLAKVHFVWNLRLYKLGICQNVCSARVPLVVIIRVTADSVYIAASQTILFVDGYSA